MSDVQHGHTGKGREGWRVFTPTGEHVATSYVDQYTLEQLAALYPEGYTFEPITLTRSNLY